jgi:Enoyl-(Acyl carrier protein) reductase
LGHIDILVNNAETFEAATWDDLDFDLWQRVMAVDLNGPMLMCKAFLPLMRGRGWGQVINIASATVAIASPVSIAYRTSKMGVIGFTRALSATLGDEGITINAVLPSLPRTAMTEGLPQAIVDASLGRQVIHREAEPADIAGSVLFVNVPIGIALEVASFLSLRESAVGPASRRLDLAGAVTVTAGMALVVFGIVSTGSYAWISPRTIATLAGGAAVLVSFVVIEARFAPNPIVPSARSAAAPSPSPTPSPPSSALWSSAATSSSGLLAGKHCVDGDRVVHRRANPVPRQAEVRPVDLDLAIQRHLAVGAGDRRVEGHRAGPAADAEAARHPDASVIRPDAVDGEGDVRVVGGVEEVG